MATAVINEFKLVSPALYHEFPIGPDATLHCHLSPELSAVAMEIRWFRETDCVCLYNNGQVTEGRGYEGRVNLVPQELERGHVSLHLRVFRESDEGVYLCQAISGDTRYEITVAVGHLSDRRISRDMEAVVPTDVLLMLIERNKGWSAEERMKMEKSALLTEFGVESVEDVLLKMRDSLKGKEKELLVNKQELKKSNMELEKTSQQLEHMAKQASERERRLENELETSKRHLETLGKQLQDKNSQLQEMIEQYRQLKSTGEVSGRTTVRRRHSQDSIPPNMSGETPDLLDPVKGGDSMPPGHPKFVGESSHPGSPARDPEESQLRLVLLGRAGSGKSEAGNSILGREEMSPAGTPPVSQQSGSRQGEVAGRQLAVVDTPDWFSPGVSLEEVRQDVKRCVCLSAPGTHAFLLVIPVKPSTGEERGMLGKMEEMFGEGCWRHTIILFTITDGPQGKNIEKFIQSGTQELQTLVEKCGNRFHSLHIKETGDSSQVSELLEKIEKMVTGNKERFYSSEIYLQAETQIREMERKILVEREKLKEEMKERMVRKLREKLEEGVINSLRATEEEMLKLGGITKKLEAQTAELERKIQEERDEEKIRELELKLKSEIEQRKEMEREISALIEERETKRSEMEATHRQEMEEIRALYEGEARMEAERNTMRTILPELWSYFWFVISKMENVSLAQIQDKGIEVHKPSQRQTETHRDIWQMEEDREKGGGQDNTEEEEMGIEGEDGEKDRRVRKTRGGDGQDKGSEGLMGWFRHLCGCCSTEEMYQPVELSDVVVNTGSAK